MATNDFIIDLVDKLNEDSIEYILITVQKGKKENLGTAYFNFKTVAGTDIIFQTLDKVIDDITVDESSPLNEAHPGNTDDEDDEDGDESDDEDDEDDGELN